MKTDHFPNQSLKQENVLNTNEQYFKQLPGVIKSPITGTEKNGIQLFQVTEWPNKLDLHSENGSASSVDLLPPVYALHGEPGSWWGGIGYEAGYGGIFAVISFKGKQFKICSDDIVISEKLPQDINEKIICEHVLAIGTLEYSLFGRPYLPFASVTLTVEQQTLTSEVISFKFKKRKRYRKTKFHRQAVTFLRVNEINFIRPDRQQLKPLITARDPGAPLLAQNAKIL
eukprot:jgi/Galph1/1181/GphlegSOOS_G6050.1